MTVGRRIFLKMCAVGISLTAAVIEACDDGGAGTGSYGYGLYGYSAAKGIQQRIRHALDRQDIAWGPGRVIG